jgi:hypothetical protein
MTEGKQGAGAPHIASHHIITSPRLRPGVTCACEPVGVQPSLGVPAAAWRQPCALRPAPPHLGGDSSPLIPPQPPRPPPQQAEEEAARLQQQLAACGAELGRAAAELAEAAAAAAAAERAAAARVRAAQAEGEGRLAEQAAELGARLAEAQRAQMEADMGMHRRLAEQEQELVGRCAARWPRSRQGFRAAARACCGASSGAARGAEACPASDAAACVCRLQAVEAEWRGRLAAALRECEARHQEELRAREAQLQEADREWHGRLVEAGKAAGGWPGCLAPPWRPLLPALPAAVPASRPGLPSWHGMLLFGGGGGRETGGWDWWLRRGLPPPSLPAHLPGLQPCSWPPPPSPHTCRPLPP